jgi:multidrug efflux pump subunit AcrA (membrane-fusion protein)
MLRRTFLVCGLLACGIIGVLVARTGAEQSGPSSASEARIRYPECLVSFIKRYNIPVPAQEAGVLLSLEAHEGMEVEAEAMLGQIDDSEPQSKKKVALAEHAVAKAEAENDVDIRFSKASAQVKKKEYELNKAANDHAVKAKPITELERLWLEWNKAYLAIEQAGVKQATDKLKADAKEAEVEATENGIQRRKIVAPLSGEVIDIYVGVGEWLSPGSSVLRIAQMDKLQVEGKLSIKDFGPGQVINRPVRVVAQVGPNRVEEFQGKIVNVDARLLEGKYRAVAEVINRRDNGDGPWLLRDGMQPEEMIIDALPSKVAAPAAQRSGTGTR